MTEVDKYEKMTNEDFDRILKDIVSKMSADQILSYGDVNAFLREELNNDVLTAWEREQSAKSDQVERDIFLFGEVVDWSKERGGSREKKYMSLDTLNDLLEKGFINPDDQGTESGPEYSELIDALKVSPEKLTVSGHVHQDRIDLESIDGDNMDVKEMDQLVWVIHWANDYTFDIEGGRIFAYWG